MTDDDALGHHEEDVVLIQPHRAHGVVRGDPARTCFATYAQAENAAAYLGRGSHVNIVGRVKNNNFEKDSETVCGMGFTVEEIDYLDNRAEAEARRAGDGRAQPNAARHAAHANA